MMLYILGILIFAIILMIAIKGLKTSNKAQDSLLKRRAIFTTPQQLLFVRLKELLPNYLILVHVSYDSLLTTKFPHTRAKYREMVADFVILNENYQVLTIITLENLFIAKRSRDFLYEEELLKSAGYRVLHYKGIPEQAELHSKLREYVQDDIHSRIKNLEFHPSSPTEKMILVDNFSQ